MFRITGSVKGVNLVLLDRFALFANYVRENLRCGGGIRTMERQAQLYQARIDWLKYEAYTKGEGPWAPKVSFQATAARPGTSWHQADPGPRGAMDVFFAGSTVHTPQTDPRTCRYHEAKLLQLGIILPVDDEHWHGQRADRSRAEGHYETMGDELFYTGDAPYPPALGDNPVLKLGSAGPDVGDAQDLLGITRDRDFGPLTEAAVKEFQKHAGLVDANGEPDGVIGPKTVAALLSMVKLPRVSLAKLDAAALDGDAATVTVVLGTAFKYVP